VFHVSRPVDVVGLIENVPGVHPRVVAKPGDDSGDIGLQLIMAFGILQQVHAGALHPAGIVEVRFGRALPPQLRERIPYAIQRHKHHADVMLMRQPKELVHAPQQPFLVLLPQQVMQKHAHAIEAEVFRPTQFPFDGRWVPRFRLPHFKLVDGGARPKIAPGEPRLLRIPRVRLSHGPLLARLAHKREQG